MPCWVKEVDFVAVSILAALGIGFWGPFLWVGSGEGGGVGVTCFKVGLAPVFTFTWQSPWPIPQTMSGRRRRDSWESSDRSARE